jgi:hypothetical protein
VREHRAIGGRSRFERADHTDGARVAAGVVAVVHAVDVHRRALVGHEHAAVLPLAEQLRRVVVGDIAAVFFGLIDVHHRER